MQHFESSVASGHEKKTPLRAERGVFQKKTKGRRGSVRREAPQAQRSMQLLDVT
jgi:hypothetical protein